MPRRPRPAAGLGGLALVLVLTTGAGIALAAPPTPSFPATIEEHAAYDAQTTCSPTTKAGTAALRTLLTSAYRETGDLGIVRDCAIGGVSEHKEGRAWDWKVNAFDPDQDTAAQDLFAWLFATDADGNAHAMARRLGIMYMIYNRQIWSANQASSGWRPYLGASPHTDHVHISLSRLGGDKGTSYWAGGTVAPVARTAIDTKYATLGGASGLLGAPVDVEHALSTGRFRAFQAGSIYWSAATGAFEVHGSVRQRYAETGWERGPLGYPVSDERGTPDGRGRYSHFQGGSIYWTPATGAQPVTGSIRAAWARVGWELSPLGYPTAPERRAPDGAGRFSTFERGSVYWSPLTGAHEVHGSIAGAWAATGWERGLLGYPLSDELVAPDGAGRFNQFQGGSVYWSPRTGAHEVHGSIAGAWAATGWERGSLGYPLSDEYAVPGGQRSDFQGGSILWNRSTGATTVLPR